MDVFRKYVKERASAMAVFVKARQRLEQVAADLYAEEVDAHERAKTEAEKIAWLKAEQTSVASSLTKITSLLG